MKYGKIIVVVITAVIAVSLGYYFSVALPIQAEPEVNMRLKIQEELPKCDSITSYDWSVWSTIFRDSGGTLTKMGSWNQFKEAFRQASVYTVMLDEEHRVVWFKGSFTQAVYFEY